MTKDAFYFPHDSNAKDDPKCMLLIDQLGLMGYGIFWVLVETLRDQKDYKCRLNLVPALAKRYGGSTEMFMSVIKRFELFEIEEDNFFYSPSLIARMNLWEMAKDEKRNRALKGANARWGKQIAIASNENTQAMHKQCTSNAQAMQTDATIREEKRREETIREETIRENNPSLLPLINEVMDYFDFNEQTHFANLRTITQAVNLLSHGQLIAHFTTQFAGYKACKPDKRFRHSFPKFIGTIDNHFTDGAWNSENWPERAAAMAADKPLTGGLSYDDVAAQAKERLKQQRHAARTA